MDFKIGEVEEKSTAQKTKERDKKLTMIIVVTVALIFGLLFFAIANALLGTKEPEEEPAKEVKLEVTNQNVKILYSYVTYGTGVRRNEKFIKEKKVTIDSFTNQEKLYYAFQFVQAKDLVFTEKYDDNHKKIYNLPDEVIRDNVIRFFGPNASYTTLEDFTYQFKNFSYGGQNLAKLTPSTGPTGGYNLVFEGTNKEEDSSLVEPFYTSLVAAYQEPNGSYRLEEKIIYVQLSKVSDSYNVYIYKDYGKTQLIEAKTNQTEAMLVANPIQMNDYLEVASTITYRFNLYNNTLYFESSEITMK